MINPLHTLLPVLLMLMLTASEKIDAQTNKSEFEIFCADVRDVRKTADGAFEAIKGNLRSEIGNTMKETIHETTKWIAGAKDCSIKNTFGNSYYASFGEFDTQKDAEIKFSYYLTYFDLCFMGDRVVKEEEEPTETL